jgi:hypothetical protein
MLCGTIKILLEKPMELLPVKKIGFTKLEPKTHVGRGGYPLSHILPNLIFYLERKFLKEINIPANCAGKSLKT